jgi:phosphatidylethanolamine/phosphatidyl-N-methylethanolamine N-methyltransferase
MSKLMREESTRKIYDVQSRIYDATFGRLVRNRIGRAIEHMNVSDTDVVLDLGIGTGASLTFYPPHKGRIVGIDLSAGMLRECRKKVVDRGLSASVFQADAMHLPFGDDTFDQIFISHVITVVSDPFRLIREAQRVAKAGAKIVIVNHFQSTNRVIAFIEKIANPICTKIGWRSDLALKDLLDQTGATVDYRYKLRHIDLWETVVLTNDKSAVAKAAPAPVETPAATVGWTVQPRPAFG